MSRTSSQPATESASAKTSRRVTAQRRALVAAIVAGVAAIALLVDLVPINRIEFGRTPVHTDPATLIPLTILSSSNSLDESPSLQIVTPTLDQWSIEFDLDNLGSGVRRQCIVEIVIVDEAHPGGYKSTARIGRNGPDGRLSTREWQYSVSFGGTEEHYPLHECVSLDEQGVTYESTDAYLAPGRGPDFKIDARSNSGASLFPFDRWQATFFVYTMATINDGRPRPMAPRLSFSSHANTWDVSARLDTIFPGFEETDGSASATQVVLTVARPFSIRLFTILLLLSLLGLEIGVYFIPDTNTTIGVIIGVVFGLWSIHELLVPPGMPAVNLVRSIILLLYVVLIVVAFLRFFVKPLLQTTDSAESVAVDAAETAEDSSLDH